MMYMLLSACCGDKGERQDFMSVFYVLLSVEGMNGYVEKRRNGNVA